ncbi:arylsulfatase A-like enzyme [Brachybacterium muris]|uniref:sulfatase-like hydrolase/transferase n=1 Tax=Brachybacterium muris TaxID=219301 RepID=UPI00195E3E54|nr:arylsulfatase A-like enzyme [Brachybacterium muris]
MATWAASAPTTSPPPHLDSLCQGGIKLSRCYANSPVCSPSRAALLTGKHPAHAGVEQILGGSRRTPGLPPQDTLATLLRERGYRTGLFGKWHLGAAEEFAPTRYGFEEVFGFRAGCVDYYSHIFSWGGHDPVHDLWDGEEEVWRNGEYLTTAIGQRASDFITRHAGGDLFFCFVPFNARHYPMHAPAEHMERVAHLPPGRRETGAMIAALDDAVGEILAALDAAGAREGTIVLFSSDNGPSRESRNRLGGEEISYEGGSSGGLRGAKGSLFEGGIRVPGILSWPTGLPSGVESEQVGLMMDVLPTFLHAADGVAPDLPERDEVSLLDVLKDPGATVPERTVAWAYGGQVAVRRGRFKIVSDVRAGMDPPAVVERALYDLEADPREEFDVFVREAEVMRALGEELEGYWRRIAEWGRAAAVP